MLPGCVLRDACADLAAPPASDKSAIGIGKNVQVGETQPSNPSKASSAKSAN